MGMYVPVFNTVFGMVPIDGRAWAKVAVSIVVHLCVVEAGKYAIRSVKPKSEMAGGGLGSPAAAVMGGNGVEKEVMA